MIVEKENGNDSYKTEKPNERSCEIMTRAGKKKLLEAFTSEDRFAMEVEQKNSESDSGHS